MHRDLRGNPKTGKTTGTELHYRQWIYNTERITTLLRVDQPHKALRACCCSHNYGAAHASLSHTLHTRNSAHSVLYYYCLKVCPSCIYTYTTFWLFTYLAPMGRTFRLFTSIVSRVGYIHDSELATSPSSTRLLSLPIRSDLFPNIIIIITIIIIIVEFSNS